MIRNIISTLATEKQKRFLRARRSELKKAWVKRFRSYDAGDLERALAGMGIQPSDVLLVHANYQPLSGFEGTPNDLVSVLVDLVAREGTLLMVSQPFRGYAYDYLSLGKTFNVSRTVSMMGLVTEMFRRRPGTLRSLHPTHPVLASGVDAQWIVAGHEACLYPCGVGSPFDRFRLRKGKILFFDVGSGANTFFHHVEDLIKDQLDFPLYDERLFTVPVVDAEGRELAVSTYAFARGVVRHTDRLEAELARRGKLIRGRVGNSDLLMVESADVVQAIREMISAGERLIEPPAAQEKQWKTR